MRRETHEAARVVRVWSVERGSEGDSDTLRKPQDRLNVPCSPPESPVAHGSHPGGRREPPVMPLRLQKRLHSYGRVGTLENERLDHAAFSRVERTGIEPVTSGLQSRRSPS